MTEEEKMRNITPQYSAEALEMTFAWLGERLGFVSVAQNFTNCFKAHYTSLVDQSEHTFYFPPVHEHEDIDYPVFPGDDRSYLEIEQELLDAGHSEESLSRLYPNIVGNGHPDVCLCPECAPDEYINYEDEHPF